jgi:hypothetical protein
MLDWIDHVATSTTPLKVKVANGKVVSSNQEVKDIS